MPFSKIKNAEVQLSILDLLFILKFFSLAKYLVLDTLVPG